MEHEQSIVRGIVRGLDSGFALVEVEQGGCGRCHEEGGCGGQHLTQMFCSGPRVYRVSNEVGAVEGERVTVAIEPGSLRRVANLAYFFPFSVAIAGAGIGMYVRNDIGAMIGAGLGLLMAYSFVYYRMRYLNTKTLGHPRIVARP